MSSYQASGGSDIPKSFPEVPPSGELGNYRNSIAFALGELTTQVRVLADGQRELAANFEKLRQSSNDDFKLVRSDIKTISEKILVAKTQVDSAFYTSKWFFAVVAAILGFLAGHWSWVTRAVGP